MLHAPPSGVVKDSPGREAGVFSPVSPETPRPTLRVLQGLYDHLTTQIFNRISVERTRPDAVELPALAAKEQQARAAYAAALREAFG